MPQTYVFQREKYIAYNICWKTAILRFFFTHNERKVYTEARCISERRNETKKKGNGSGSRSLSVRACACFRVCVCVYVCMYIWVNVWVCLRVCVCRFTCSCMRVREAAAATAVAKRKQWRNMWKRKERNDSSAKTKEKLYIHMVHGTYICICVRVYIYSTHIYK